MLKIFDSANRRAIEQLNKRIGGVNARIGELSTVSACTHQRTEFKNTITGLLLFAANYSPWQLVCADCGKVLHYYQSEKEFLEAQIAHGEELKARLKALKK